MTWEQAQPTAGPLRFAIFVGEQNVPSGIELDDQDAECVHAVAFDVDGKPIGTGRLLPDGHHRPHGGGQGMASAAASAPRSCRR